MRGFIFYESFAQASRTLGDKARLKLYDSIVDLGLCCVENETELEQVCAEIESKLAQNRNVLAQFLLIKQQIIINLKKYINGKKGKDFGMLGGAPKGNKNASKNNPKTTPIYNINNNINNRINNNKENNNINVITKEVENKKQQGEQIDFEEFWKEYPKQRAGNKQKAFASYKRVLQEKRATVESLLEAVKRYSASEEVKRGFAKGCQAWLNDDRFNNEYDSEKPKMSEQEERDIAWRKWLDSQVVDG